MEPSHSRGHNSGLVSEGTVLLNRWTVERKIAGGGFGEIYEATDKNNSSKVAVKVESMQQMKCLIPMEVAVLKRIQGNSHACVLHACGHHPDFNFMVMSLLGVNLSDLRRFRPNGTFSLGTTMRLLIQMIDAIRCVHDKGFVHRDIKPSNFAMGLSSADRETVHILDFGLCRVYLTKNGDVRPPRRCPGFRGTVRYASLNAHKNRDLSRVDDLWSLLYVAVEFSTSTLPWKSVKDFGDVGRMKANIDSHELIKCMPQEMGQFVDHIQTLSYADKPNYDLLKQYLVDCLHRHQLDESTPFDWNTTSEQSTHSPSELKHKDNFLKMQNCHAKLKKNKFSLANPTTWLHLFSITSSRDTTHAVAESTRSARNHDESESSTRADTHLSQAMGST